MIYCINPVCTQRQNPDHREYCQYCGTSLLIADQYRLLHPLRPLPRVNQIEVFECDHRGTRKVMKVGSSRGKMGELLEREALILQMLEHPSIPSSRRRDFFPFTPREAAPLSCLVMEKIDGNTLEEWVEVNGHASRQQILDWLFQAAEVLKVLHEHQFIHCDIKPDNLILSPKGQLVLVDFGAGTFLSEGRTMAIGTVRYMAPEHADGTPETQSDFFSLGRTMIRLASGVPLRSLQKDSQTGLLLWRNLAPHIEKPLADLLDQIASPTLGLRPQTAQVILDALQQIPGAIKRFQRRKRLRSKPAIALYGLVSCLLGWAVFQAASQYRAVIHDSQGLYCLEQGDNICAVREFDQAIKLNEKLWTAHYHLGSVYDDQKIYDLAEDQYVLAIQYSPYNTALPINNLARLKILRRDYQGAIDLVWQGLDRTQDPLQLSSLYKNLGWANFKQGDYKLARQHLQQSIAYAADQADPFCLLAQVEQKLGNRSEGKRSWQSCLVLNSQNPEVEQWRNQVLDKVL